MNTERSKAPRPLLLYCRATYGERAPRMLPCYMRGNLNLYAAPGKGNRAARRALAQCTLKLGTIVPPESWTLKTCRALAPALVRVVNFKTQIPWK